MEAPCADAIMHQINHSPDSVVFDPYGSLRFEEMPSNAAEIGSNRSDEITGHVHDYVPLPERFGGSSAPTKPAEALLCLPSELSHLGSRRPRPAAMATKAAKGSAAAATAAATTTATVAKGSAAAATATAAKGSAAAATASVAKAAAERARAPVAQLESTRRRAPRPRTAPSERMLAGWTLAGAISKPCGDISVAGMTELPPGTDHAVLVASVMAAVRGFSGYRGVPHLKVNWVGRFANGGPHANKKIPRPSHSGQPRATTDGRQPPECESATATERGPRTHDADEQSSESGSGCRE